MRLNVVSSNGYEVTRPYPDTSANKLTLPVETIIVPSFCVVLIATLEMIPA